MSAIGPGDWVECIGPAGVTSPICADFVGRHLYCVEQLVWTGKCGKCGSREHAGLHLVGKRRTKHGWAGCGFRPIYRPNADLIEALKQPAPSEPATAEGRRMLVASAAAIPAEDRG